MRKIFEILISIVALVIFVYFSFQTYKSAVKLEQVNKNYYEAQTSISDLLTNKLNSLIDILHLGKKEQSNKLNQLKAKRIILKEKSQKYLIYLGAVTAVLILLYFILNKTLYAILISISSIAALSFGIVTPILMIVIHKYVNYLGDIILSFESKTILGTIEHLYSTQNYPVALTILLFSIVVPYVKTLLMLIIAIFKEFHIAGKLMNLFKHLGKWSMLDVFVVSLLLVYFSMGSSQNSYSEIENGLYLFLIYVILSLINSLVVEKIVSLK